MIARGFIAFLLLMSSPKVLSEASTTPDLKPFEDKTSETTLLIPQVLIGREKKTKYGFVWQDANIDIGTLNFPPERSLRDIYEKLIARPGRRISRNEYDDLGFRIEGINREGSSFITVIQKASYSVSGEKTLGVSVTYDTGGGPPLRELAEEVVESFRPGSIIDPDSSPGAYLQDARKILAEASKNGTRTNWSEFGILMRKLQLRVGRKVSNNAIQALFQDYPSSPLRSAAWGRLPLGILANFSNRAYNTYSIYGEKSQHPVTHKNLELFLAQNPDDPYIFLVYYGLGNFDKAIESAEMNRMQNGVLHYAAGHKLLSGLLTEVIPNLDRPQKNSYKTDSLFFDQAINRCTISNTLPECFFFETFRVHDRLAIFLERAPVTAKAKMRSALEANPERLRQIIAYFTRSAALSQGQPHGDDAHYYLGLINRYLGKKSEAIKHFAAAMSSDGQGFQADYFYAARHQVIEMMLELPDNEKLSLVRDNSGLSKQSSLWYALARDSYRHHDYQQTIRLTEEGLEKIGIEAWRLPFTTDPSRIEDALKPLSRSSIPGYVDPNLGELVYLLNASREMSKFEAILQDRAAMQPQRVRAIILKYSLLTTTAEEEEKLFGGKLGQHRDWRQSIHLADTSLQLISRGLSPQLDLLREWLFYRKVRILSRYEPRSIEATIETFENEYPKSKLLDDAYAELLRAQAFDLKSSRATVEATFRLIVDRFPGENAVDNAYNWYAIYLQEMKDYASARKTNLEIIRKFPVTRHAMYAAKRLTLSSD